MEASYQPAQSTGRVARLRAARTPETREQYRQLKQEEVDSFTALARAYEVEVNRLVQYEVMDKHNHRDINTDIQKRFEIYGRLLADDDLTIPQAVDNQNPEEDPEQAGVYSIADDRRQNILYQLYLHYRCDSNGTTDADYYEFSEATAGRALIRLLAYHYQGRDLLAQLYRDDELHLLPQTTDARQFIADGHMYIIPPSSEEYAQWAMQRDYVVDDPFETYLAEVESKDTILSVEHIPDPVTRQNYTQHFLALLYREVPGSKRAVGKMLAAYGQKVRQIQPAGTAADDDELPLQLPEETYVTWDAMSAMLGLDLQPVTPATEEVDYAMEKAITEYVSGKSLKNAAKSHGVWSDRLSNELKRRGLMRQRGRKRTG